MRAVTADHVMFNECIPMFRPEKIEIEDNDTEYTGYLLLDFRLTETLNFEYFKIHPTIEVRLAGAYASFIAPVQLPNWFLYGHNSHLFTIALAAVFSFITGRPVQAPRDDYYDSSGNPLEQSDLAVLALQFPVLTAGPGNHGTRLSRKSIEKIKNEMDDFVDILYNLPYNLYKSSMQSIRLVHLSHINKRNDFGLAYYLLVSSMEPMVKDAVKKKKFYAEHRLADKWKELSNQDEDVKELLRLYKKSYGESQQIAKRFVEFILLYCPPEEWKELEHPHADLVNSSEELTGVKDDWMLEKQWFETYPEDLSEDEINELLKDLYTHRSKYSHEGTNPPHQNPISYTRFFEIRRNIIEKDDQFYHEELLLPNFRLVSFIASRTLWNYLKEQIGN